MTSHRRLKQYGVLLLAVFGLLLQSSCSKGPSGPGDDKTAGGGVETGNTFAYGYVINESGTPVAGVDVNLFPGNYLNGLSGQGQIIRNTKTNPMGLYRFDSLTNGNYQVLGQYGQDTLTFSKDLLISRADTDSVNLGTDTLRLSSTVQGTISVYSGHSPAGIKVFIRATGFSAVVNASGDFIFKGVPRGDYVLVADASNLGITIPQMASIEVPYLSTVTKNIFIPQPPTLNLAFTLGQKWGYRMTIIFQNQSSARPETLITFVNYNYASDTLIDNKTFCKINETYYDVGWFIIGPTLHGTKFVHISSDTVSVLNQGYIPGALLKSAAAAAPNSALSAAYDTSVFNDLYFPILFNLFSGKTWYYRPYNDLHGNLPMLRNYLGNEIVNVPAGAYNCYRMEWDWSETYGKDFNARTIGVDWISDIGIVKRLFKFDSVNTQVFEYVGPDTIPFDTLFSIYRVMPQSMLDSINNAVAVHWSLAKYAEWFRELYLTDTTVYRGPDLQIDGLVASIWGDTIQDAMQFLATTSSFPAGIENYQCKSQFVHYVVKYYQFAQGWDDCDWDWKTRGLWNVNDTLAPFGISQLAGALKDTLNFYFVYDQSPCK